jgi:hypothetical protein
MPKVLFKGWKYHNLQKIPLTKLFQQKLSLSLKKAKVKTDALLDGESFIFETESIEQAEDIVNEATVLGAVCEIIKDND